MSDWIEQANAMAYDKWVKDCQETVKTMPDAIRLLHSIYRDWCHDQNSEHSSFCSMPKDLTLNYAGWMLDQMKENADKWPTDKLNRWLGYVQAILVVHGITSVEAERKRTRPIFHAIYHREGIIPPASVEP